MDDPNLKPPTPSVNPPLEVDSGVTPPPPPPSSTPSNPTPAPTAPVGIPATPPPPPAVAPTAPTTMNEDAAAPVPTPEIASKPKRKWGTGALVGSVLSLLIIAGGVFFGYRAVQQRTNPPSFAGTCSCIAPGTACSGSRIPNGSCDGQAGDPVDGQGQACCSNVDPEATPPTQAEPQTCAQKAGQSGGPCSNQFEFACGGDGCQTKCDGGTWKLTGNICPPGNAGDDPTSETNDPVVPGGSTCGGSNCVLYSQGPLSGGGTCSGIDNQVYSCCPSGKVIQNGICVDSTSGGDTGGTGGTGFGICYDPNNVGGGGNNTTPACENGSGSQYCNASGCTLPSIAGMTCWIKHYVCNDINAANCNDQEIGGNTFSRNCGTEQIDLTCGNIDQVTYFEFASKSYAANCGTAPTTAPKDCFERCDLSVNECKTGLSCDNKGGVSMCYADSCNPPQGTPGPTPNPSIPPQSNYQCQQVKAFRGGSEIQLSQIQMGDVITFRGFASAVNTTVSKMRFVLTKGGVAQTPVDANTTLVAGQYQADYQITVDTATSYAVTATPISP